MNTEEHLTKLEESVAHLTLANEELSGELEKQWKRIEMLERKLAHFQARYQELEELVGTPVENTKPPHY